MVELFKSYLNPNLIGKRIEKQALILRKSFEN
jgi:hypothetical protein